MNIKNIWTPKFKLMAGAILSLAILIFFIWLAGYRFNLTPSLPKGLYQLSQDEVQRGDLVTFCLASDNAFGALAKERGYLGPGSCPSGLRPLLKHLAGLPGDRLEISPNGLILNGRLLSGTVRPAQDFKGRLLPPSLLKAGVIPEGEALVLSQEHSGSFDSRHFGLVPLSSLKKVRPVLTFNNLPEHPSIRERIYTMTIQSSTATENMSKVENAELAASIMLESCNLPKNKKGVLSRMVFKLNNSVEIEDDMHAYLLDNNVQNYDLSLDDYGNLLGVGVDLAASFKAPPIFPNCKLY